MTPRIFGAIACWALAAAALGSCAGASGSRCGHGRSGSPRAGGTQGGAYCLMIEVEGVGNVDLQVNRAPQPTRGGDEEEEEEGTAGGGGGGRRRAASGPVTYTLGAPPSSVRWTDICSAPGARRTLPMVDDNDIQMPEPGAPPIAFPIRVWDQVVTAPFTLSSNGWMAFQPNVSGSLAGQVPNPASPNLTVAPFWQDLYTRYTGICYGSVGAAPNRRFIVQWQDLHYCCTDDPTVHLTFQIVINEARPPRLNNVIDVIYNQMDGAANRTSSAGFENAQGTMGVNIPPPFTAPRSVRLTPSR